MEKPRFFLISSEDRTAGTSSEFTITMTPGLLQIKSVKLSTVSLPLTNYIINSQNNMIYFGDATSDYSASLNPGVYDYITIIPEIKRAMEDFYPGDITASYSDELMKFQISSSTPISLTFSNTINSAAYILGFANDDTVLAMSHLANSVAHLSVPSVIFINISALPNLCTTTNKQSPSFIIFSKCNSGYVNFHAANTDYILQSNGTVQPLQYFHVNVTTKDGQILDLNGTNWDMLLELEYFE